MNEATTEAVRASIVPKSDQLNSDDLLTGPITVTIENVRRGDKEQPIIVDISGHRPYKPCKSMRRILIAAYSDDPKQWVGKRMRLFCDPDVTWAGVRVGGIRISHLSGLDKAHVFMITQTRGKKSEMTIQPLQEESSEAQEIAKCRESIANAKTSDELKSVGVGMKSKPKPVQDAIRGEYSKRQKELAALTPLQLFEAEIEASKDSKKKLLELSPRALGFGDETQRLETLINQYYATATDDR